MYYAARDVSPLTSVLVANGTQQSASFTFSKCISKRCLTCLKFSVNKTFTQNVTKKSILLLITLGKTLRVTLVTWFIYLLVTLFTFNIQHVGKTALPLHECINKHRRAKFGCEYMIMHFWHDCVGSSFSIQILEVFEGDDYVNGTVCPIARKRRLEPEERPLDENAENQTSIWSQWLG